MADSAKPRLRMSADPLWGCPSHPPYHYGFNCSGRVIWQGPPELDPGLNAREDECWRMFGISVEYYYDERVVTHGA